MYDKMFDFTGKHTYLHIIIHLDDYCERGKAWKIWENMQFVDASKPDEFYDGGELSWLDFQGAWGNIQTIVSKYSCLEFYLCNITVR